MQGGGAFKVGIGSKDSPPCAMTPTQQISYFLFASALIVNGVCLLRSGAGRLNDLFATGSAAPRIRHSVLGPSPVQEGCEDAGEVTAMGYQDVQ